LPFEISLAPRVVRDVGKLPTQDRRRIDAILVELAAGGANLQFRKLQGYDNLWRIRKDPWRVLFELEGLNILVVKIDRRDVVYRK
jgi:mRNA-degrading endonuclease RelE of RelBE toxin-antitoxin system